MEPSSVQTARDKRSARTPAVALCVGLLLGGVWLAVMYPMSYFAHRAAGSDRGYYRGALHIVRAELALHGIAVRQFAQRTGHLPTALAECREDLVDIRQLAAWAGENANPNKPDLCWYAFGFYDPERDAARGEEPRAERLPPSGFDVFGLPILYRRGSGGDGETWVRSTDPLPAGVVSYLNAHGGVPTLGTTEPFALSSLFLQDRVAFLRGREHWAALVTAVFYAGLTLIVAGTIWLAIRWRKRCPWSWPDRLMVVITALVAATLALFGRATTGATCYRQTSFTVSDLPAAERLALLDEAVRKGEVPADAAKTARDYIEREGKQ